jgi:hypothetical protein
VNKSAVTQAQMKRAFAVAADLGLAVSALRVNPNGSAELLFGDASPSMSIPVDDADDGTWEAYDRRWANSDAKGSK